VTFTISSTPFSRFFSAFLLITSPSSWALF
jgi:hypothetical protein